MIFGFFKKKNDANEAEEEEEVDPVQFKGPLSGVEANLGGNAKIVDAGLVPAKDLLTDALSRRAEMIRIEPKGVQSVVTVMVDGMPFSGGRLSKPEATAITQVLKLLAGLDVKQRKAAQSGGLKAEFKSKPYHLMLATAPLPDGERLTIRANDQTLKLDTPTELGMSPALREKLRDATDKKGVLLTAGPPGSGTTTTNFAVLRGTDAFTHQIYSLCDVDGRKLVNITPFEANPGDDLGTTLDRVIRVEADTLFVEPIKSAELAKLVFKKAEVITFISEMTAKDVASAVVQLNEWVGDPKLVSESLLGIVTQKLIRLLCKDCKQAYRPNPDFLKKAGLPSEVTTLYRKPPETEDPNVEPCGTCGAVGYLGRAAMFEFLEMTDGMKELIAKKPDAAAIKTQMKKDKMLTLSQDGLRLVAEGKTGMDELQRVFKAPSA